MRFRFGDKIRSTTLNMSLAVYCWLGLLTIPVSNRCTAGSDGYLSALSEVWAPTVNPSVKTRKVTAAIRIIILLSLIGYKEIS